MPTSQDEFYRGLECAGSALAKAGDDASARAAAVHTAITPLLGATEVTEQLACRSGCAHCCHFPVGVTFAEASRLADAIRGDGELMRAVLDEDHRTANQTWLQLVGQPCPLLREHACARYEQRPLPCRALGSLDEAACAEQLTSHAPSTYPRDEAAWFRGLGAAKALADEPGTRELRAAVAALLRAETTSTNAFAAARAVPVA